MRSLRLLLALLPILFLMPVCYAVPIDYFGNVTDSSGVPVQSITPSAWSAVTVVIHRKGRADVTITGSNVTVVANSSSLTTTTINPDAATPTAQIVLMGDGIVSLSYDADATGEAAVAIKSLTVSGVTFSSNYTVPLVASVDSSRISAGISSAGKVNLPTTAPSGYGYSGLSTNDILAIWNQSLNPTFTAGSLGEKFKLVVVDSQGRVTTSNPANTSSGPTASDFVTALLNTQLDGANWLVKDALYYAGQNIPVSEGEPGPFTANTATSGKYTSSNAPWYRDTQYFRTTKAGSSTTVVFTSRVYYDSTKTKVVGKSVIFGTQP